MNLLNLAPDIQEQLLFAVSTSATEHHLRTLTAEADWKRQRELWRQMA
jgi:hypothetical protein